MNRYNHVKDYQAGGIKPLEETQTAKLIGKGKNEISIQIPGFFPNLSVMTIRITNLTHSIRHNWTSAKSIPRAGALLPVILSLVSPLYRDSNGITHRENKKNARIRITITHTWNCGITYGNLNKAPNNQGYISLGPLTRGGDGGVVVRNNYFGRATASVLQARTFNSKAGYNSIAKRGSELEILHNSNSNASINIKQIYNMKNLVSAYELIKSNPGNMTPGANRDVTLDGMNLNYLESVQKALKAGTYKFNPARRIQIPKPGKKETRPLTIASPREKIVQKAIQLSMEQVYEKKFLDCSHGFRPNRGTKTAIRYIDAKFQSVHYIIEADFSKAFDKIQHNKLLEIMKEDIKCDKTLALIKSSLKAGYVEFGTLHENLTIGTPQGSILSPLLCNIYLHKLDLYMEEIKVEFDKGGRRQRSVEYTRLQNKAKY